MRKRTLLTYPLGNDTQQAGRLQRLGRWLGLALLALSGPAAFAQLSGTYTINNALPTGGTNYASFAAAATALNQGGVSGPVTFNVSGGPYTEQLMLSTISGASAANRITFNGNGRTIRFAPSTSTSRAVVALNGTDYVTLDSLNIDATNGGSTGTYGWGVLLTGQANNNIVRRSVISTSTSATTTNYSGIVVSGSTSTATTTGNNANNLLLEGNTIIGGYYGVTLIGATATRGSGNILRNNIIRDYYYYGIYDSYQSNVLLTGNDLSRATRTNAGTCYGLYVYYNIGGRIENNRLHDLYTANPTSTGALYAIYVYYSDGTSAAPIEIVNNQIHHSSGSGLAYGLYNYYSDFVNYYHNTVVFDNPGQATGSLRAAYLYNSNSIALRNNLLYATQPASTGTFAIYNYATASYTGQTSNYNDLYVGTGGYLGYSGTSTTSTTGATTLAAWRSQGFDQNSVSINPMFANAAANNLTPTEGALNGAGTPTTLATVPRDANGTLRTSPPDLGALEFTPVANDIAVVSIDAPTTTAVPGNNPVTVTIRNGGATTITSVTLSYVVDSRMPVTQNFTGLTLAAGATQQLTFTTGFAVPSGSHTLTVTGSLPNGAADGNANNNTQTFTFNQPTPDNDEPCTAIGISNTPVTGSNSGASTSEQTGIVLPSCSPAATPKDVWFSFVPTTTDLGLNIAGQPAGMVRVFTAPDCAAGPFAQVFCQSSNANNTSVGNVALTGLTIGQRYYVAISGYGSADTQGAFTISTTVVTGTRHAANYLLTVFPNPSTTGLLTLRLAGSAAGAGTAELLNSLGQSVLRQPLSGPEAQLSTRGLAAGLYTLQVRAGGQVMTRKVELQ
jgi:hypothetical protein